MHLKVSLLITFLKSCISKKSLLLHSLEMTGTFFKERLRSTIQNMRTWDPWWTQRRDHGAEELGGSTSELIRREKVAWKAWEGQRRLYCQTTVLPLMVSGALLRTWTVTFTLWGVLDDLFLFSGNIASEFVADAFIWTGHWSEACLHWNEVHWEIVTFYDVFHRAFNRSKVQLQYLQDKTMVDASSKPVAQNINGDDQRG